MTNLILQKRPYLVSTWLINLNTNQSKKDTRKIPMDTLSDKQKGNLISVLAVDDHHLFREGLRSLFNNWEDIELTGSTGDAGEALDMTRRLYPQVVVLDIMMPGTDGITLAEKILKIDSGTNILVLTMHNNQEFVFRALKIGCKGYILKEESPAILREGIITVAQGKRYLCPKIVNIFVDYVMSDNSPKESSLSLLTSREYQVGTLLIQGRSTEEIGIALSISPKTVRVHVGNLMKKFSCSSRAELTLKLLELLHLPSLST